MTNQSETKTPLTERQCVRILDTSLRDGEQAPGFSMQGEQKLRLARALTELNVDVIEAGFAAASPGDAEAIFQIAAEVEGPIVCALARALETDIRAAVNALRPAHRRRVHVFIATSPIHRKAKLGMSRDQVIEAIRRGVAFARQFTDDVEFSAEDACRTEEEFLAEALSVAAAEGASTLNVPDTVGYATPEEIESLFRLLIAHVSRPPSVIFSAHCHNDLGLALSNSLAAVRGGARQVECTLHGIGERAGNCSLEELVMALRTRGDHYEVFTEIEVSKIMAASAVLSDITQPPAPNKAIVGANAFAHESGIHQHGVLKDRRTYEIMRPADVGCLGDGLVLGKHSGRHGLAARATALGFALDEDTLGDAFEDFKRIADEIGTVGDVRLKSLLKRYCRSEAGS